MDWRVRFGVEKYFLLGLALGLGVSAICIWVVLAIFNLVGGSA